MTDAFEELKTKLQENGALRSVTDDLINRLESKVPKGAFGGPVPPPIDNNSLIIGNKIREMEEATKKLSEKLEELSNKQSKPSSSDMLVGTQDAMQNACDALQKIVETFNTALEDWYEKTGCVVSFSWKYAPCKLLDVAGIDVIVYRKEAPSSLKIKEVLDEAPKSV